MIIPAWNMYNRDISRELQNHQKVSQPVSGSGKKSKAAFLEDIAPKLNIKGRQVGCRRRVGAGSRVKASMGVCEETASWLVEQLRWKPDRKTGL